MAGGYIKAVENWLPQADIIFDRFHVQRLASDAVDEVRRSMVLPSTLFQGVPIRLPQGDWSLRCDGFIFPVPSVVLGKIKRAGSHNCQRSDSTVEQQFFEELDCSKEVTATHCDNEVDGIEALCAEKAMRKIASGSSPRLGFPAGRTAKAPPTARAIDREAQAIDDDCDVDVISEPSEFNGCDSSQESGAGRKRQPVDVLSRTPSFSNPLRAA